MPKDCATPATLSNTEQSSEKRGSGQCEDCDKYFLCFFGGQQRDPETGMIDCPLSLYTMNCLRNNYCHYKYKECVWPKIEDKEKDWTWELVNAIVFFALCLVALLTVVIALFLWLS